MRFPLVASLIVPRGLVARCPSWRIRARPAAYRPQGFPSQGGGNSPGGAYIPSRFPQLISSAPAHRLIRPTDRRSIRTGKQDGGRSSARHRITAPSRLRPVSSLVSAGGAKSVSLLSAGSVSGPRCPRPRSGARHRRRLGPAVITASKQVRAARPRSAPRIGRARSHRPTPLVAPSSARRASKQDGGGSHSVRPPRSRSASSSYPPRPSCRMAGRSHPSRRIASLTRIGGRDGWGAVSGSSSRFARHEKGGAGVCPRPLVSFLFRCGPFVSRSYRRCSG